MLRLDNDQYWFPTKIAAVTGELDRARLFVVVLSDSEDIPGTFELEDRATLFGTLRQWLYYLGKSLGAPDGAATDRWSAITADRLVEFALATDEQPRA